MLIIGPLHRPPRGDSVCRTTDCAGGREGHFPLPGQGPASCYGLSVRMTTSPEPKALAWEGLELGHEQLYLGSKDNTNDPTPSTGGPKGAPQCSGPEDLCWRWWPTPHSSLRQCPAKSATLWVVPTAAPPWMYSVSQGRTVGLGKMGPAETGRWGGGRGGWSGACLQWAVEGGRGA